MAFFVQAEDGIRDRPNWIDVLQGIEADASKSPCRFIAQEMGDEAMCRFMKGDGDYYWDHPNGRQVEHIRQGAVLRARLPHLLVKQPGSRRGRSARPSLPTCDSLIMPHRALCY